MRVRFTLALFCICMNTAFSQKCAVENRNQDLQPCLREITQIAQDSVRFWFGSSFYQRCPEGQVLTDSECALYSGRTVPESISSLAYPDGNFNPQTLDRYLNVKYISRPGNYTGCDNEYHSNSTYYFTANPLSMETINCWDTRDFPEVTWDSSSDEFYSLVVLDVAYNVLHSIYMNIQGDNITIANAVYPYRGPLQPSRFGNAYVFFLFLQHGLSVPDTKFSNRYKGQPFSVEEFKIIQNVTGPVGMNWVLAAGDTYSIGRAREAGLVDNCPVFIADAIVEPPRPFIQVKPKLDVGVYPTYRPERINFTSCCQHVLLRNNTVKLKPLEHGVVAPVDARSSPEVVLVRTIMDFKPDTGFIGKLYNLLMIDPDANIPAVGSNERPFVHWMINNIAGGDVTSGTEVLPYKRPLPSDDNVHQYYFLLYEQKGSLDSNSHVPFVGESCSGIASGRCFFNITGYVSENSLKLAGASWMFTHADEFVRYSRVKLGEPEAELCKNVPGYVDGC